jgi:hypothetical protein
MARDLLQRWSVGGRRFWGTLNIMYRRRRVFRYRNRLTRGTASMRAIVVQAEEKTSRQALQVEGFEIRYCRWLKVPVGSQETI